MSHEMVMRRRAKLPNRDTTIRLRDGRSLAYCEWGHARGPVVLAFHGSPGSRVWWPGEAHTKAAKVRLVTVDRPGYGGSDPLPGRPKAGWASDVAELAEALGIDRFGLIGWSGGASYAAAVAAALPDRLTGVCLVSSASLIWVVAPTEPDEEDRHVLDLIERFGPAGATIRYAEENRAWAEDLLQDPASIIDPQKLPEGDRWLFEEPEQAEGFFDSIQEALRQGAIGAASDWLSSYLPWGFSPDEIEPAVHLWHGRQDGGVSLQSLELVVASLPRGTLTVWPDAGHFGIAKYWSSVLEAALG